MIFLRFLVIVAIVVFSVGAPLVGYLESGSLDMLLWTCGAALFWIAVFRAAFAGFTLEGRR